MNHLKHCKINKANAVELDIKRSRWCLTSRPLHCPSPMGPTALLCHPAGLGGIGRRRRQRAPAGRLGHLPGPVGVSTGRTWCGVAQPPLADMCHCTRGPRALYRAPHAFRGAPPRGHESTRYAKKKHTSKAINNQ